MAGASHQRLTWRDVGVLLAVLALALRLVVPAGFMLSQGSGLVICTGQGALTVVPGQDGAPAPSDRPDHHPCAFAAAAADGFRTLLAAAEPVRFAVPAAVLIPLLRAQRPGLGLAAPPPPTTGPPLQP